MVLDLPPIFLLSTHLHPEELHELEDKIDSLTYDINEAEIVVGNISRRERAMFELRRAKLETAPLVTMDVGEAAEAEAGEGGSEAPSRKRRKVSESTDQEKQTVKVVKLTWLRDSMEQGVMLPLAPFLLYEGRKSPPKAPAKPKPTTQASSPSGGILKRAAMDQLEEPTARISLSRARHGGASSPSSSHPRPKLAHESTSEHGLALPAVPHFLKTTYSCQRPTPVGPPNDDFVDALKRVRTVRILRGDQVGVRAYSTAIATVAAYPYLLKTSEGEDRRLSRQHELKLTTQTEVARLPGCGARIAELYQQWRDTGSFDEIRKAESDAMVSALQLFYDIWGVGDTTAREFYRKGLFHLSRAGPLFGA